MEKNRLIMKGATRETNVKVKPEPSEINERNNEGGKGDEGSAIMGEI